KDLEGASAACEQAIKLGESASSCYEQMGDAALKKTRNFAFAAECYSRAVQSDPENVTAMWNIGTALEAAGQFAAALPEYEAALKRYGSLGYSTFDLQKKVDELRRQSATSRTAAQ